MSLTFSSLRSVAAIALVAVATLCATQEAWGAEREHATLTYRVASDVHGCPDQRAFAEAVAARLGYDPFVATEPPARPTVPPRAVDVQIGRLAGKLEGKLTLEQTRAIQSTSCPALVDSLAATLALIFDPLGEGPAKKPDASDPQAPSPAPPVPPAPTAPRAVDSPPPSRAAKAELLPPSIVWLGVRGSVGATPSVRPGLELGGHLRFARAFSLEGTVSASLPGSTTDPAVRGSVSAFPMSLLLGFCTHLEPMFACGALSGGYLFASASGTDIAHADGAFTAEVSLQGGALLPLTDRLSFRGALEGSVPLARTSLAIDQHVLWTTAPVIGRLSLGLGIRL